MTTPADPTAMTARSLVALVQRKQLSAEDVTQAFLARIARSEPDVEAWAFLDPDRALAEARAVDGGRAAGPLAGLPVGVKDVIDTADMPTGYGSAAYSGFRPATDAPCVALSRDAGAVILGKTVSTEFAMASPGKTRNPANPAHTPGGSSSGSCAAVAAGHVPMAFGTQTSGSIIRPAAYCGVVGYKPSFGTLDRTAIKPLAGSLDTLGVVTRNVRDAAFCTAVLGRRPLLTVGSAMPPPRVGLFTTSRWSQAGPGTRLALERACEALARRAVTVKTVPVPDWFDPVFDVQNAVFGWEVTQALAFERLTMADRLTATTRAFLDAMGQVTLTDYDAAIASQRGMGARLAALFADIDVLITPAAPDEAPQGLAATGDPVFNRAWSLLHGPCLSVPAGRGAQGLPVAVQIVGQPGTDARTLAAAAFIEDALTGLDLDGTLP